MFTFSPQRWPTRGLTLACLGALALVLAPATAEGKPKEDKKQDETDVDFVELAALLVRDGHYDRAELTLRQVDLKAEGVDLIRYHTLSGLVFLKKQLYTQAKQSLLAALKAGQTDPVIHLQLAQANFGLQDYPGTVASLDRAGEAAKSLPAAYLMRAEAEFKQSKTAAGFAALNEGAKRFPQERALARMRLFRLVDQKLYQEAVELGRRYLEGTKEPEDFLALGDALRKSGQLSQAAELAEQGRLRFADNRELTMLLAHVQLDQQRPLAAAMLLEDLSREHPEYTVEAAELYRRASRHTRALMLNARVLDQKAKLKQRLSILIEMGSYESVAAMAPRLSRLSLLEDESVRYALAYGYFKIGDFASAEQHLRQLSSTQMFERANQLRRAMESCKERGWECT